jgi:hypothetical protein
MIWFKCKDFFGYTERHRVNTEKHRAISLWPSVVLRGPLCKFLFLELFFQYLKLMLKIRCEDLLPKISVYLIICPVPSLIDLSGISNRHIIRYSKE